MKKLMTILAIVLVVGLVGLMSAGCKPVATEEEPAPTPENTRVASEAFVGAMGQFIDMMTTEEGLVGYWNDNRGQITTIQNQHADLYQKMVEMFTNRKAAILKGETKDA